MLNGDAILIPACHGLLGDKVLGFGDEGLTLLQLWVVVEDNVICLPSFFVAKNVGIEQEMATQCCAGDVPS